MAYIGGGGANLGIRKPVGGTPSKGMRTPSPQRSVSPVAQAPAVGGSTAGRGGNTSGLAGYMAQQPQTQRPQQRNATPVDPGTQSGLGTNDQGAVSAMSAPAAPAVPTAQDNWNNSSQDQRNTMSQDDQYKDETGAAQAEYENLLAQLGQQKTNYELDNKNSLRNLGDMGGGLWNQTDKLTGYGNAFQQQQGDFASRGMLESSGYGTALSDMNRGFGQQRDDIGTALKQFTEGQALDTTQATGNRDMAKTMSQRQALQRMANSLGL